MRWDRPVPLAIAWHLKPETDHAGASFMNQRLGVKHFTASALIESEGRFLLLRHPKIGLWLYPGGHVEADEEPQDAVTREVQEEIGSSVSILSFRPWAVDHENWPIDGAVEIPMPLSMLCERIAGPKDQHHWHIDMVYLCHLHNSRATSSWSPDKIRFVTPEEAEKLDTPPELPALMRRAKSLLSSGSYTLIK